MKFVFLLIVIEFCMAEIEIEEITRVDQRCELGEGPHWDVEKQSLFYVNILEDSAIFRYDLKSGEIFKATIKEDKSPIGFIVPVDGKVDEFIIGARRRLLLIKWDGQAWEADILKVLAEVDSNLEGNRINDGKVDPNGNLFFGTMGDESKFSLIDHRVGSLYRFTNDTGISVVDGFKENVGVSNGLSWDVKNQKFYYIDSVTRDVKVFDYNHSKSIVTNPSVLINFNETHSGELFAADGMTIDKDGKIYVATWNGSKVIVIDPKTKKIIREIQMPTKQITSLAFGGKNLDILYATSAGRPKPQESPAGAIFKITGLNAKGVPMNKFKLY